MFLPPSADPSVTNHADLSHGVAVDFLERLGEMLRDARRDDYEPARRGEGSGFSRPFTLRELDVSTKLKGDQFLPFNCMLIITVIRV